MKILTISGSLRKDSYNRMVIEYIKQIASEANLEVTEIDLEKLDLPILNTDKEAPSANELNKMVQEADIIAISTPEYNRSIPAGLKNAIDYLDGQTPLIGKVVMLTGASTGGFGTVRAQLHLREVLFAMGATITPLPEIYINHAKEKFSEDGSITDTKLQEELKELLQNSIELANKL